MVDPAVWDSVWRGLLMARRLAGHRHCLYMLGRTAKYGVGLLQSAFLTNVSHFVQTSPVTQKLLFICTQNRLRSPTAEQVFSSWEGLECDSSGLAPDATVPLSTEQIAWADIIFVMEKTHRNKLSKKFRPQLNGKRIIVLGIPDDFEFMEEGLVRLLKAKVPQFLR